ncbi:unnamed protein product, partial [Timema podura]|nr:unnamed protein product [Timema podura]
MMCVDLAQAFILGKKRIMSSKSESEIAPKIKQEKSPTKLRRNYNSLCIEETNEELKYRRKRFPDVAKVIEENVKCTSCTRYLKELIIEGKNVYRHPTLNVLLCQKCSGFYDDGDFSVDEDGTDKYCRWCGQGGMLYCCAKCTCAFCKVSCTKKRS